MTERDASFAIAVIVTVVAVVWIAVEVRLWRQHAKRSRRG